MEENEDYKNPKRNPFYVMATNLFFRMELQLILWVNLVNYKKINSSVFSLGTGSIFQDSSACRFLNKLMNELWFCWGKKVI